MICPKCGSNAVDVQLMQENAGSQTITKTKSKYKEKGHGCLWWLLIGWWWWMVDLFLWIFIFPIRLLFQIFKKKKYVGDSTSSSTTINRTSYRSMAICRNCGNHWDASNTPAYAPRPQERQTASQTTRATIPEVTREEDMSAKAQRIADTLHDSDCTQALILALLNEKTFSVEEVKKHSGYDEARAQAVMQRIENSGMVTKRMVGRFVILTWV